MNCPLCNHKTIVTDTRKHKRGWKRRRDCTECLTRFTTFEQIEFSSLPEYVKDKVKQIEA